MGQLIDNTFDALAHEKRREILFTLLENPGRTNAVIEQLSMGEEIHVEYKHTHLPKLDDYGFIDWDPTTKEVEKGPVFPEIEPILNHLLNDTDLLPEME